jgi:hypothetical protein
MITNRHETAALNGDGVERTFTLRDHVIAQLDHLTAEERAHVLATAAAFTQDGVEGTRLPGPEPYFRLQVAPDLLMFVERKPGAPVDVFDITRPGTLRMFANAARAG